MLCSNHRPATALAALFAGSLAAAPALAAPLLVTSTADSGEGSLRAALEAASSADTAQSIVITADGTIQISSTLAYTGMAPLTIIGAGQTIASSEDITLLAATMGADLSVSNLDFAGPGGFSIENRSPNGAAAGKGIFIDVRDDQTGTVVLELINVTVTGTAGHGVHVSDCTLADDCGAGGGGVGEGSPASIDLSLINVEIVDTAYGRFDADGLRVDERGEGSITFGAFGSRFAGIGADGIELDEGQAGDVVANIISTEFIGNGGYCDPDLLAAFLPDAPEGKFDEGEMAEDAIPGPVTGSPDDGCFERAVDFYDDGSVEEFEFAIDVDDGFDIDEAGPGSLFVTVFDAVMDNNLDEGFDFDEEDGGSISATFHFTSASGNTDDGYKMSEEGLGDVIGTVVDSVATENGGVGFVFEEEDEGSVEVTVIGAETSGNDDGDLGLEVVQEDEGEGVVRVLSSDLFDGSATEGATLTTD